LGEIPSLERLPVGILRLLFGVQVFRAGLVKIPSLERPPVGILPPPQPLEAASTMPFVTCQSAAASDKIDRTRLAYVMVRILEETDGQT
jgi:hypothetical protein